MNDSLQTRNKRSLVIIGGGMAAGRLLDEIRKRAPEAFHITVVGDEPEGSYNRIMLSPVLAEELARNSIISKPGAWFEAHAIRFLGGQRAVSINRASKSVRLDSGLVVEYDELVIATGSRPARIPARNQQLENIYSFRTLKDVDRIAVAAQVCLEGAAGAGSGRVLVIGGGLLGLEAAYGLAKRGLPVTLVHRGAWLLNRQLDEVAGGLLRSEMEKMNIEFELAAEVEEFMGNSSLEAAKLTSGKLLSCQLAVVATGITPNRELGISAGLEGEFGVQVDDFMGTSDPFISALGECVEHRGATFGLVDPIWQQCITLADRLCYNRWTPFINRPVATKLKVAGVQLFSAGNHLPRGNQRELVLHDAGAGVYRKVLLENNRIVGVVMFGDTRDGPDYFNMMEEGADVSALLPSLLLGKAFFCAGANSLAA